MMTPPFDQHSQPAPGPAAAFAAKTARSRRPGARYWLILGGAVAGVSAAALMTAPGSQLAAKVRAASPLAAYSVTVPVNFVPRDPDLWAVLSADDFAAAQALDPSLPDPAAISWADAAAVPDVDPAKLRLETFVGPPARALPLRGVTELDRQRAMYCLTAAIYYEAASETDDGMRGVAQTIVNRVHHPSYPNTVCGVVFQGSQRAGVCQFTFSCDGAMARAPNRAIWARSSRIAADALAGKVFAGVGLATHYHTQAIWPRWGKSLVMTNIVGAHIFHRWRGRWGMPDAFRAPYAGREPVPGPYLPVAQQLAILSGRAVQPVDSALGGVVGGAASGTAASISPAPLPGSAAVLAPAPAISGANPAPPRAIGTAPAASPAPTVYADRRLNQSGEVRDEFRGSGEWLK